MVSISLFAFQPIILIVASFYVSWRAFGRESGKTARLKSHELVLKSRSNSPSRAHSPESDTSEVGLFQTTQSNNSSRIMEPSNSSNNPNNPTGLTPNVTGPFFNSPAPYPAIPNFGGYYTTSPPNQVLNAAPQPSQTGEVFSVTRNQLLELLVQAQQMASNTYSFIS